jgi:hypothetical protein
MKATVQTYMGVMAFYIFLSYVLFPLGFYHFVNKTLLSAGNGFIVGSIVSIVLWMTYGKKLV